VGGRQPVTVDA